MHTVPVEVKDNPEPIASAPVPVEVTEVTSGTITPAPDPMPVRIDWERLEQPEPWELDPF
jgi:hypothetical protein